MKSTDYIIERLNAFIKEVRNAHIRYGYDEDALVHTIEVTPIELYRDNEYYKEWESSMFDDFVSQYPGENICFISDNAIVGIDEILYDRTGLNCGYTSNRENGNFLFNAVPRFTFGRTCVNSTEITINDPQNHPDMDIVTISSNYTTYTKAA